jgi:hypothetical protein
MRDFIDALTLWLQNTRFANWFLDHGAWTWPMAESLHFIGLTMLIGSIGIIDLRILGLGKGIRISDLHRFVRFTIGGFLLNLTTGSMFVTAMPDQYFLNRAFQFKLAFLTLAGLNVLAFYGSQFRRLKQLGPHEEAPLPARLMAGLSLVCWIGVITAGRLLTFYRP